MAGYLVMVNQNLGTRKSHLITERVDTQAGIVTSCKAWLRNKPLADAIEAIYDEIDEKSKEPIQVKITVSRQA